MFFHKEINARLSSLERNKLKKHSLGHQAQLTNGTWPVDGDVRRRRRVQALDGVVGRRRRDVGGHRRLRVAPLTTSG